MSLKKSAKKPKSRAYANAVFVNPLLAESYSVSVNEFCSNGCGVLSPSIAMKIGQCEIVGSRIRWTCSKCSPTGEAVTELVEPKIQEVNSAPIFKSKLAVYKSKLAAEIESETTLPDEDVPEVGTQAPFAGEDEPADGEPADGIEEESVEVES